MDQSNGDGSISPDMTEFGGFKVGLSSAIRSLSPLLIDEFPRFSSCQLADGAPRFRMLCGYGNLSLCFLIRSLTSGTSF